MAPAVSCHALMRLSPLLRLLAVARLWPSAVVQDRQILNAALSLNSRAIVVPAVVQDRQILNAALSLNSRAIIVPAVVQDRQILNAASSLAARLWVGPTE